MPRAEKKIEGVGWMAGMREDHVEESCSLMALSLGLVALGWRRPMTWTLSMEGSERRLERMKEPYMDGISKADRTDNSTGSLTTSPVPPTTIVETILSSYMSCLFNVGKECWLAVRLYGKHNM